MPNKRFLGLGFTFSATDKGLEKKLKGIQSALSGITNSLNDISSASTSAKKSISQVGKVKTTKTKTSSLKTSMPVRIMNKRPILVKVSNIDKVTKPSAAAQEKVKKVPSKVMSKKQWEKAFPGMTRHRKDLSSASEDTMLRGRSAYLAHLQGKGMGMADETEKIKKKFDKTATPLGKVFDKLPARSKEFVKIIEDSFGSDLAKSFIVQAKDIRVNVDKMGNLTLESMQKLVKTAMQVADASKEIEVRYKKIITVFNAIREWFSDVSSSAKNFLSTIGVDMSKIVPEQIKALYGVLRSALIKPLTSGIKFMFGKMVQRRAEKLAKAQLVSLEKVNDKLVMISERLGGSATDNLNAAIKGIKKELKPKKGIWDFLKTVGLELLGLIASPLALAAGFVVGFGEALRWVIKSKYMEKVVKLFENMYKYLSKTKVGEVFGKIISRISEAFSRIINVISKSKLGQVIAKIISKFEVFGPAISKVVSVFTKIVGFLAKSKIFMAIFKVGKIFGKAIAWPLIIYDVIKGIYDGLNEGKTLIEKIVLSLWHVFDNLLVGIPGAIADFGKKIFMSDTPVKKTGVMRDRYGVGEPDTTMSSAALELQKETIGQGRNLSSLYDENMKQQTELSSVMIALQKQSLDEMRRQTQAIEDGKNINVSTQLRGKLKGPGMNVVFDEMAAMGTAGN